MSDIKKVPDDLMTKAVAVKCILRFTRQDEWAQIIAEAILFERNEERNRAKKVVKEILSRKPDQDQTASFIQEAYDQGFRDGKGDMR